MRLLYISPLPPLTLRSARWTFFLCYSASGAAALLYEVTWTRVFTLELGHTVAASSAVLAAVMGGLAAGAWLAGRFPPPPHRRLHAYAALEILIALLALAIPFALHAFRPLLQWAYSDGDAPARFNVVRIALSLTMLGLPAAAMGATFPIVAAWLADAAERMRRGGNGQTAADASILYAMNTAGAAIGAISAGYWLIPAVGLRATSWIGAVLNIAAAAGALWIARGQIPVITQPANMTADQPRAKAGRRRPASRPPPVVASHRAHALTAAALSGFAGLVYEVIWARLLALVIGPTTYAFATMAAVFISGIAIGSAAGARLARRVSQPGLWLAATLVATAATAMLGTWIAASRVPLLVAHRVANGSGFGSVLTLEIISVVILILPTSIAMGCTFALALATAAPASASIGSETARIYAVNSLGAVTGALMAGFVLIPNLGLEGTIVATGRLLLIAATLLAATLLIERAADTRRWRIPIAIAVAGCVVLIVAARVPGWDRDLLTSGAYKYPRYIKADDLDTILRAGRLEYYKEGAAGTVSVRRLGGSRALAIDGKVDASDAADMLTQRLLGVLPVLLHPQPKDILVIGLGSGVTLGSALASSEVQHADVVEISPEVVEASEFFSGVAQNAVHAPGVRLLIGDGRSHLLHSSRRYDVIISEPSNPWMAGVGALFTREFFAAGRARLTPGGIICQWAHTYEISAADLKSIVGTFASVFPQGTMWLVGGGDLLMIGTTDDDIESRLSGVITRSGTEAVAAALADVAIAPGTAPFVVLSQFAGGPAALASYGSGAPIQTDDRMTLEFSAVRAMYAPSSDDNAAAIRALLSDQPPPSRIASILKDADAASWTSRGAAELKANAYGMAFESFRQAAAIDSRSAEALRGASDAAARAQRLDVVRKWLEQMAASDPSNVAARVELSHVLAASGDPAAAIAAATDAARIEPDDPRPQEQLASVLADAGDGERLRPLAEHLVERFADRGDGHYYQATALFLLGRTSEAVAEARRVLELNPRNAKAQNLLGAGCATAGDLACARAAFDASISADPRDPSSYVNLGQLYLQLGDANAAVTTLTEALALDPQSTAARDALAQARAAAGK
jgi:spermidine synthase